MSDKTCISAIPAKDLKVSGVYRTYVNELVKILEINEDKQRIKLYNISGAHNQWIDFKYINISSKVR